jgi:hypothetical protein
MADSVSKSRLADRLEAARNILTSATGAITAFTALVVATGAFVHFWFPSGVSSNPATNDKCKPPYVWREATPDDHVCVDTRTRQQTLQDNSFAASRRDPRGGSYGPDTCLVGYVWRDIFDGDHVCVTPETRTQAAQDNREAPNRIEH